MTSDQQIIEGCAKHDRKAQQLLYDKYSRFLLGGMLPTKLKQKIFCRIVF